MKAPIGDSVRLIRRAAAMPAGTSTHLTGSASKSAIIKSAIIMSAIIVSGIIDGTEATRAHLLTVISFTSSLESVRGSHVRRALVP
jgi:hypothetical protein